MKSLELFNFGGYSARFYGSSRRQPARYDTLQFYLFRLS